MVRVFTNARIIPMLLNESIKRREKRCQCSQDYLLKHILTMHHGLHVGSEKGVIIGFGGSQHCGAILDQ
jgi:hypothetical protein